MDDDLLLPCPFCGGRAVFDVSDKGYVSAECGECGTRGPGFKSSDGYELARNHWSARNADDLSSKGLVVVPIEPTDAMLIAGSRSGFPGRVWRYMVEAAIDEEER